LQGRNLLSSLTLGEGWVGGLLGLFVNLALLLPVVIGNVVLFVTVPLLAEKFERHTTFAAKENAIMLKLVFFQVRVSPSKNGPPRGNKIRMNPSPSLS